MKKNQGSALVWTLAMLLIVTALLACILPLASSAILTSRERNRKQQAYYTAKSVVDMVAEYIVSDVKNDPGKTMLQKAMAAEKETGISWDVNGLNEGMGACKVNLRYEDSTLYIKATATDGEEERTVVAKLKQSDTAGALESAEEYVSGYEGIRANQIQAIGSSQAKTEGNAISMSNTNILILEPTENDYEDIVLNPEKLDSTTAKSAIVINRTDAAAQKSGTGGSMVLSKSDMINEKAVTGDTVSSLVSNGNLAFLNEKNLFRIRPNFVTSVPAINGTRYGLYACKTMKVVGQVEFAQVGGSYNVTGGNIYLSGRDVDKDNEIPVGITSTGYSFYVKDVMEVDHVTIVGRENSGVIYDNGPFYITNKYGPSTIQGNASETSTSYCINSTMCTISSTKKYPINIIGNIQCNALKEKEDAIDAYVEKEKKKDETFDEKPYEEKKKQYRGDVVIDGKEDTVYIKGDIYAKGTVTLKGKVKIEGVVASTNVVIEGKDVEITGGCYAYNNFRYKDEKGTTHEVDKTKYASENKGVGLNRGLGMFVYENVADAYTFTPFNSLNANQKNMANKGNSVTYIRGTGRTITYIENVDDKVKKAQENMPKVIRDIPEITKVSPGKPLSNLELRDNTSPYKAYEYSGNCNLGKMKINSYGDVYLIVGEGNIVSVDSISSDMMSGNVYFIVRKGARLRINDVNNRADVKMKVGIYSEDGGCVVIGDHTSICGNVDVDRLEVGKEVTFERGDSVSLSGSVSKGNSRWKIIQYTDGE